jgi:elongation factor 4
MIINKFLSRYGNTLNSIKSSSNKFLNTELPYFKELKFSYFKFGLKMFSDTVISNSDDLKKLVNKIEKSTLDNITQDKIRNFCIIAHIDHGKSTLSDRLLESSGAINKLEKKDSQVLDTLKVERERGITVKAQTASMILTRGEEDYLLNLIDTPGHVDFSYEVARSLRPCQGAILLVDATKGVQAQTLSNFQKAKEQNLTVIPVINKVDLPSAQIESVMHQMTNTLKFKEDEILQISAKTGLNIDKLFDSVLQIIPCPKGDPEKPVKLLLFDARYVETRGVILLVEVIDGILKKGDSLKSYHSDKKYDVFEVGVVQPILNVTGELKTGQVGYILTNMKEISDARIGDTFYSNKIHKKEDIIPMPGFEIGKCMVYAGVYPTDPGDFDDLKRSIQKMQLSDASIKVDYEQSSALGSGFRIGFLGMLHLDVFTQRLEDEYDQQILVTSPSVPYRCTLRNKQKLIVENALSCPPRENIVQWEELFCFAYIITPKQFLGNITRLVIDKRGEELDLEEIDDDYVKMTYELPLCELVTDFFDKLKSLTQGYASLDYEITDYKNSDIKVLSFLLNGEVIDALSILVHTSNADVFARKFCRKLRDNIPQQLFQIPVQAMLDKKIICREDIKALRKNVTAKCYGGDHTRKLKLLEKQKKGKKKMRALGSVNVTSETFLALLKNDEEEGQS